LVYSLTEKNLNKNYTSKSNLSNTGQLEELSKNGDSSDLVDEFADYEKNMNKALEERRAIEDKESVNPTIVIMPLEDIQSSAIDVTPSLLERRRLNRQKTRDKLSIEQLPTIPSASVMGELVK
jgi:hypothetical protein